MELLLRGRIEKTGQRGSDGLFFPLFHNSSSLSPATLRLRSGFGVGLCRWLSVVVRMASEKADATTWRLLRTDFYKVFEP